MTENTPPAGGAVVWIDPDDLAMGEGGTCADLYPSQIGAAFVPLYTQPPATVPLDAVRGLVARLDSVTRYEAEIGGGCECCGSWVEHEIDRLGDWIKYDDLKSIRDELEALTREATK